MVRVGILAILAIVFIMPFFTAIDSTGDDISGCEMILLELRAAAGEMIRVGAVAILAIVRSVVLFAPYDLAHSKLITFINTFFYL